MTVTLTPRVREEKTYDGVDVFQMPTGFSPTTCRDDQRRHPDSWLQLKMITNRGVKVWPDGMPETFCVDQWRCRFHAPEPGRQQRRHRQPAQPAHRRRSGVRQIEGLYRFDGVPGYSLGQGQ